MSHSIIREKKAKSFFSLESLPFFSKICFQQPLRFFKIWSYYFRSESEITSWTLTKCSLRFVIFDNSIIWETKGQNLFFSRKIAFFSKICSQHSLMFLKNWSYYFRSICQNTSSSLIKCCLRMAILDNTRKKGQNIFLLERLLFFKNLCFPTTS